MSNLEHLYGSFSSTLYLFNAPPTVRICFFPIRENRGGQDESYTIIYINHQKMSAILVPLIQQNTAIKMSMNYTDLDESLRNCSINSRITQTKMCNSRIN